MIQQKNMSEYKSPTAALLWSLALPGFGQLYNGEFFLGLTLLLLELVINNTSGLNVAIMESFHGDFEHPHYVLNYQWGMFYPSLWFFSMWQAYNKAKMINAWLDGRKKEFTKLTGLLFGMTVGSNLGIYWHPHSYNGNIELFLFMKSPIFFGLFLGIILGFIGHFIENTLRKYHKN